MVATILWESLPVHILLRVAIFICIIHKGWNVLHKTKHTKLHTDTMIHITYQRACNCHNSFSMYHFETSIVSNL
jgi:hypothetical protein